MKGNVLITGGAGFIGSHLTDELVRQGYSVRILDNLSEVIHGKGRKTPEYLNPSAELIVGDVRDPNAVRQALENIEIVYHFASTVGAGKSMYEIREFVDVNETGTAVLLEALIEKPVKKLIVGSSMSIYGEGLYKGPNGRIYEGKERNYDQLKGQDWEIHNKKGAKLSPVSTPETKSPELSSIYALSKYDQERMCMLIGKAYNIPTVALRFFNVYGPRQINLNPNIGVFPVFVSRLINDRAPLIYENGLQKRDFVNIKDVIASCILAIENLNAEYKIFNIGSGSNHSVIEVANKLIKALNKEDIYPEITEQYRMGDVRNCFANISYAKKILGYNPRITLEQGISELVLWLKDQEVSSKVSGVMEESHTGEFAG